MDKREEKITFFVGQNQWFVPIYNSFRRFLSPFKIVTKDCSELEVKRRTNIRRTYKVMILFNLIISINPIDQDHDHDHRTIKTYGETTEEQQLWRA